MQPTQVTDSSFENEVLKATLPVLVDFWAPWCVPCRAIAPIVEELATEYQDKVKFVQVNTDQNQAHASKLGIRGIPTLLWFKDGQEVNRITGYKPKSELQKHLDALLAGK